MKNSFYSMIIMLLLTAGFAQPQSLFDSAVTDSATASDEQAFSENSETPEDKESSLKTKTSESNVDFSGSVKGLLSSSTDDLSTENSYTEFRGKITASPSENLKSFSEIVINRRKSDTDNTEIELREAYIDVYSRFADFSIGEKIIAWGKADAVNPTNKITPYKNGVLSSNEDDRRMGNLLAEGKFSAYPFTITAIWIPLYRQTELPSFINSELTEPDSDIKNSSFALKADFENSSFDFSLSYFNGYNPSPGIEGNTGGTMNLKPYRIHNIGFDFSTTVSDYGLRGETAFQIPFADHEKIYVPSPEISYIAGIDRSIGDFTLILQYSGKYITDFIGKDELAALSPIDAEIENFNRIIANQTEELTHSAVFRLSVDLFYETLSIESAGSYNFTTEELFLKPLIVWDAADSLEISAGSFFYTGPDDTLFGMMENKSSSFFTEVKLSF